MENKKITIDISTQTILKIVAIALVLVFMYSIGKILAGIFISAVIASAIDPWIDFLSRRGVPRALSTAMFFVLILAVVVAVVWLMIPPIATQVSNLSEKLPDFYEKFSDDFARIKTFSIKYNLIDSAQGALQSLSQQFSQSVSGIYGAISGAFGGIFYAITVFVLAFYFIAQEKGVKKFVMTFTPGKYQPYISGLVNRLQEKMGAWLRGQLLLMLIVGVLTYIGLKIIGVEYALVLAIIAGLLEIIPIIGVIISIIPALFLSFVQSPILALFVLILYVIVQQLENHLLVPKVMQKAVGVNPILVIIALLIGGKLAGVLGMIVAVPVVAALVVISKDIFRKHTDNNIKMGEMAEKNRKK